jgi:hypothetical protein
VLAPSRSRALSSLRERFVANHPRLISRGNLLNLLVWVASLYYYFLVDKVLSLDKDWTKVGQRLDKG